MLYYEIRLVSGSGLRELFQTSRVGPGRSLSEALSSIASAIIAQKNAPVPNPDRYVHCRCNSCQGSIEFPAHGVGETIQCPHCGLDTVLFVPGLGIIASPSPRHANGPIDLRSWPPLISLDGGRSDQVLST